jgi:hypothetical protein
MSVDGLASPPRKKHRKYKTKTDVKHKFWLYQKVTSAELAGLKENETIQIFN